MSSLHASDQVAKLGNWDYYIFIGPLAINLLLLPVNLSSVHHHQRFPSIFIHSISTLPFHSLSGEALGSLHKSHTRNKIDLKNNFRKLQ